MKKKILIVSVALLMAGIPLLSQGQGGKGKGRKGGGNFDGGISSLLLDLPMEDISPAERRGLRFMREEEKLARDVYQALFEEWGVPIFRNIARSEQRHMDAIGVLLDKYGIADPVSSDLEGVFVNPDLQQLYIDLAAAGKISLEKAFWVGASIEDLDIFDLKNWLKKADNQDIRLAYQNLLKGSRNHLRAFVSKYQQQGFIYTAQYLSRAQVDEILAAPMERGVVDENGDPMFGPYGW